MTRFPTHSVCVQSSVRLTHRGAILIYATVIELVELHGANFILLSDSARITLHNLSSRDFADPDVASWAEISATVLRVHGYTKWMANAGSFGLTAKPNA